MPVFEYKGLQRNGKQIKGKVTADSTKGAKALLKTKGIFVTEVKDKSKKNSASKGGFSFGSKVGVEDMSLTIRQLSTLIGASVPLVESLTATANQCENPILKEVLYNLRDQVTEGISLNQALSKHPKIFNKLFISMAEAGEVSGTLDKILVELANFTESQARLNSKVKSALIYPFIMIGITFLLVIFLFVYLVPSMRDMIEGNDKPIPALTQYVFAISDFFVNNWFGMLIVFVGSIFAFFLWKGSPSGSKTWDRVVLKLPLVGKTVLIIAISRFARTLATLRNGGVDMLLSLNIVRNVVGNETLGVAIDAAKESIREGETLTAPLKRSGLFPPLLLHMIQVGEKTGDLENMLENVAESYDYQAQTKIDRLTTALQPLIILMMAGVIILVAISVFVPMMDVMSF